MISLKSSRVIEKGGSLGIEINESEVEFHYYHINIFCT